MENRFVLLKSAGERRENDYLPSVTLVERFFTPQECQNILQLSAGLKEINGGVREERAMSNERNSKVRFMEPSPQSQWVYQKLEAALEQINRNYRFHLLGFYEGIQISSYSDGGFYDWHMDIGNGSHSTRKLSMSVQLSDSDDYVGGNLEFAAIDQTAPRSIGSLIVFPSYMAHRVTPVTEGTRRSLVSWIHGHAFH
jgi:PKHD-type hydroxylase